MGVPADVILERLNRDNDRYCCELGESHDLYPGAADYYEDRQDGPNYCAYCNSCLRHCDCMRDHKTGELIRYRVGDVVRIVEGSSYYEEQGKRLGEGVIYETTKGMDDPPTDDIHVYRVRNDNDSYSDSYRFKDLEIVKRGGICAGQHKDGILPHCEEKEEEEEEEHCGCCGLHDEDCECWVCEGCGERWYKDNYRCELCELCENCCDCWICEGCDSRVREGDWCCSDCDRCSECCECKKDESDEDESGDVEEGEEMMKVCRGCGLLMSKELLTSRGYCGDCS